MKATYTTNSVEETLQFGKVIGAALQGGEVIELLSDLGGGKTALTKGIAAGLGSTDQVQSPSFTISRVYRCRDNLELHHLDLYRLEDAGVMSIELSESLQDPLVVTVIEWAGIVAQGLPAERVQIHIKTTGENSRDFELAVPESLAALSEALTNQPGVTV